jgi:hypothetical protein
VHFAAKNRMPIKAFKYRNRIISSEKSEFLSPNYIFSQVQICFSALLAKIFPDMKT